LRFVARGAGGGRRFPVNALWAGLFPGMLPQFKRIAGKTFGHFGGFGVEYNWSKDWEPKMEIPYFPKCSHFSSPSFGRQPLLKSAYKGVAGFDDVSLKPTIPCGEVVL
jgi:hypothetical protein